ncbi:MAG: hypothetical protein QXZ25_01315 [Candidatus Bathyarchaeia archaeon]
MIRLTRGETVKVRREQPRWQLKKFLQSKGALAIPVTYLILFASLLAIISATYSFAVVKINSRSATLKVSVAKQNMQLLDEAIRSVAWSFGASEVVYMDDCGGTFKIEPTAKSLILNITDGGSFYGIVFNSSVGRVLYELEPSVITNEGLYVKGDMRTIINQSAFTLTQLYFTRNDDAQELTLSYRPSAMVATIGTSNGKPLNIIRIYIINLNSSQGMMQNGKFHLKVTSVNVTTTRQRYEFNGTVSSLMIRAISTESTNVVSLPISSIEEGAIVDVEVVVCNVKLQGVNV